MISINLLTPEKRKSVEQRAFLEIAQNLIEFLLVISSLIGMLVLSADVLIAERFNAVIEQAALINQSFDITNREIRRLNNELRDINAQQNKFVPWTPTMLKIYQTVPENVRLTSFNVERESRAVAFKGVAARRSDLIKFKESLEKSELFETVSAPLSNLVAKENVQFEFRANLK